jgi:hypothetical protein
MLAFEGGPAQAGRTAHQPEQVSVRVRAQPLRFTPDLPPRCGDSLDAEVDARGGTGPLLQRRAVYRSGLAQRPLGCRDLVGRAGDVGQHLLSLGTDRLAQGA